MAGVALVLFALMTGAAAVLFALMAGVMAVVFALVGGAAAVVLRSDVEGEGSFGESFAQIWSPINMASCFTSASLRGFSLIWSLTGALGE